jgi:hypothetical protein
MGKTERIGLQIFIDVSFDQNIAPKSLRLSKKTQHGQAGPEPMHFIARKSPLHHRSVIDRRRLQGAACLGLTLIRPVELIHKERGLATLFIRPALNEPLHFDPEPIGAL